VTIWPRKHKRKTPSQAFTRSKQIYRIGRSLKFCGTVHYVELLICEKNRSLCFRTSICRIHCIDQSKTFTLLLKSNILDFETLSRVHVYRIEFVSYRQGPYWIRIETADERIVPALILEESCFKLNILIARSKLIFFLLCGH